ncbi:alpha/beta hydrolase [Falsiroseomonas selenitidurans]|uniref:Alpha/beta hydrolase n=1 Tax=Falsiroseomonas selenitidurans TaxID=2716335 RepID=A0ABX1DWZ1_9PROT|nr:alpha/beta hydrolase [Falsiroseomonas selenitidurans]NKC29409.1 alpha/beta hydrolase [Falsiroseomonas selenitidurans]
MTPLETPLLPEGLRSRMVPGVNGLDVHVLEAGQPGQKVALLLHGFPELAFSWRKVMPLLAAAGFHVVAPDLRGYGRTTGWQADYDAPLAPFLMPNILRDQLALLDAMRIGQVRLLAGHDYGSPVAAWCALVRPDVFTRVALMSAPFAGAPGWRRDAGPDVHAALAALDPPRRHYQWYYSERRAAAEMDHPPQGLHAFLRAYYHQKSADWAGNQPFELAGWTAAELAQLPGYYVMPLHATMPEAVAPFMPAAEAPWLTDAELGFYAAEYARTGFAGGLQSYRCNTTGANAAELRLFSGRRIEVPAIFIAGASDWGIHQTPGALARMQREGCADFRGLHLIPGAGHWVQQEQPQAVAALLQDFAAQPA